MARCHLLHSSEDYTLPSKTYKPMDNMDTYTQIEAYLNGELQGDELQKFEEKMQTDSDFAVQVQEHRELETMLTSVEIDHWKQRAKALLEEKRQQPTPRIQPITETKSQHKLPYYLFRAAAVILLLAGLTYFFIPRPSATPEQLAMNYFEQTESSIYSGIERGEEEDNPEEKLLNAAHEHYQQKKYPQAILQLQKIPSNSPLHPESLLLIGLCQLHLQHTIEAIQNFQTVANHPNTLSKEEANWLLALAFLQNGELEKGKELLENIGAEKGGFSEQALSLLKEL